MSAQDFTAEQLATISRFGFDRPPRPHELGGGAREVDVDAIARLAAAQERAYRLMLEIDRGIGALPQEEFEDMIAWDRATENGHADIVLALVAELRRLRTTVEHLRAGGSIPPGVS